MYIVGVEAKDINFSDESREFWYQQTIFYEELSVWSCRERSKNH